MEWSHWNFPTQEPVAAIFDNYAEAKRLLASPEHQIVVHRATTDEDRMHIGDDWECEHTLHPTECIHCNPAYRHADWETCPTCSPDRSSHTWHVDGVCLRCNPGHGSAPYDIRSKS